MITIYDLPVKIDSFPDGTIHMKQYQIGTLSHADITWKYENDQELLTLIYLVKHLRKLKYQRIHLRMPYIPNARQDRVKNRGDVFTLKYFAEILNDLHFDSVTVLDPHSSVSEALIDNIIIMPAKRYIWDVLINKLGFSHSALAYPSDFPFENDDYPLTMFYPDEGAMKRYSGMVPIPYAFGIKKRNWETGQIEGLDVAGEVDRIAGKDILIVDDICSRGGTFLHSAKKLKELGARDIYLYVSHCENTILEGELLEGDLIKKVYTTDSIFTKSHEKVEVLK